MKTKNLNKKNIQNQSKYLGIELLRGLSVLAVVMLHSGDKTWGIVSPGAKILRDWIDFPVPFFLAASFYFATRKLISEKSNTRTKGDFILDRCQRMLIPLLVWTVIYIISKAVLYRLGGQMDSLEELLKDPLSIIFFGGASYHLYFIPWLFWGSLLILLFQYFQFRWNLFNSIVFFIISCLTSEWILDSGNDFLLGPNVAFQAMLSDKIPELNQIVIVRLLLVIIAWIINSLPYIFASITLNKLLVSITKKSQQVSVLSKQSRYLFQLLSIYLIMSFIAKFSSFRTLENVSFAFALLIIGLIISTLIQFRLASSIVSDLGDSSFGIYLLHPFILQFVELVVRQSSLIAMDNVTIFSILAIAIPTFLITWLTVTIIRTNQTLSKYAFGV